MTGSDDKKDSQRRIVDAAEDLFSSKGYDGTTVNDIAETAGVNKALIYYYFNSKSDILESLFAGLVQDVRNMVDRAFSQQDRQSLSNMDYAAVARDMFDLVFGFLLQKRKLLKILVAESLKVSPDKSQLFRIADMLIMPEVEHVVRFFEDAGMEVRMDRQTALVSEFFTGFMPMLTCIIYYDEWLEYYGFSERELKDKFFEALKLTHLAHHLDYVEQMKDEG